MDAHLGAIEPAAPATVATTDTARVVTRSDAPKPVRARRIVFGGVDFTGIGHDRGKASARVVVIDLSDFACPYCGEFARDVYPAIDRDYVQTGKVLFKYIPFLAGFRHGTEATRAAECAGEQGQFWVMMDRLYVTQAEWKSGDVADAQMAALAGTVPLDTARFVSCYASRRTDARTARATALANEIGVRVTPSFLIDGHPVQGALPLAEFRIRSRRRCWSRPVARTRIVPRRTEWRVAVPDRRGVPSVFRRLFALLAALHDVAVGEEDGLERLPPLGLFAQEELEVHAEVLHLLLLRVLHDRLRGLVLLQRDALLVPADGFRFLGEGRDHACERAGGGRELLGRLVILVESHGGVRSGLRSLR